MGTHSHSLSVRISLKYRLSIHSDECSLCVYMQFLILLSFCISSHARSQWLIYVQFWSNKPLEEIRNAYDVYTHKLHTKHRIQNQSDVLGWMWTSRAMTIWMHLCVHTMSCEIFCSIKLNDVTIKHIIILSTCFYTSYIQVKAYGTERSINPPFEA